MPPSEPEGEVPQLMHMLERAFLLRTEGVSTVWLVRHADAYDQGSADPDPALGASAIGQLRRLAARVKAWGPEVVYSSPLKRARETATALADEVVLDDRLREAGFDLSQGWLQLTESPRAVAQRMRASIAGAAGEHPGAKVLMVSHAAAIVSLATELLGLEQAQLKILPDFTSVTTIRVLGEQVVLGSLADATHLDGAPTK